MQRLIYLFCLLILLVSFISCNGGGGSGNPEESGNATSGGVPGGDVGGTTGGGGNGRELDSFLDFATSVFGPSRLPACDSSIEGKIYYLSTTN